MARMSKAPTGYWLVSIVGSLWNAFGAYLYMATNLGDRSMMHSATLAMQDYIVHMPVWAHAGWAFGIWGSMLGSLLMLARSRHAASAFAVSLLGALVSFTAQARAGVLAPAEPAGILVVIALLWWYCRGVAARGIQR